MKDRRPRHLASCTTCWFSATTLIALIMVTVILTGMPTVFSQPIDEGFASFLDEIRDILEPSKWDWSDNSFLRCRSNLGLLDDLSTDGEIRSRDSGEVDGQFLNDSPTRRIGSELLVKRSGRLSKTIQQLEPFCRYLENTGETTKEYWICQCFRRQDGDPSDDENESRSPTMKRGLGSIILSGKRENVKTGSLIGTNTAHRVMNRRMMGSEFLGKRGMGSEFLGKRGMGSEFLGKRGPMGNEFLGKRVMGNEFLGKRSIGSEFLGKRALGSEFLGKRSTSVNDEQEDIVPM